MALKRAVFLARVVSAVGLEEARQGIETFCNLRHSKTKTLFLSVSIVENVVYLLCPFLCRLRISPELRQHDPRQKKKHAR